MQGGKLIQEQPGLGVGWPRTSDGRVAPFVLPGGERMTPAGWSVDAAGNAVGLVGPGGAIRSALKPALLIATIQPQAAVTGTTVEQIIARVAVPRANLTPTTAIRVTTLWDRTNNANAVTVRIAHGQPGFVVDGASAFLHWAGGYASMAGFSITNHLWFANSLTAQRSGVVSTFNGQGALAGGSNYSTTIDYTSSDLEIAITGQLANAADSLRLQGGLIEVFSPSLDA